MDEIDKKIIELLKQDSRKPYLKIAEELGISEGAVRARVKKLVESGVIRRFTLEVSHPSIVKALVLVKVLPELSTSKVRKEIERSCRGVEWIAEISGTYDIALVITAFSIRELDGEVEKLRRIDGVLETVTNFVMNE
jgi:DNA-binding Lrp family transcriptional regulator